MTTVDIRILDARVADALPAFRETFARSAAHAARGAALNLGLSALATTAASLQDGAAHLPAHEIARLVQRFDDLLARTREAAIAAGLPQPAAPVATR